MGSLSSNAQSRAVARFNRYAVAAALCLKRMGQAESETAAQYWAQKAEEAMAKEARLAELITIPRVVKFPT